MPTEYLIREPYYLTEYIREDVDTVIEAMNNTAITDTLAGPPNIPYLSVHGEWFVGMALTSTYKTINKIWAIRDKTTGKLVGSIDVRPSDDVNPLTDCAPEYNNTEVIAEYGFWLQPDQWGKGIMTAALRAFNEKITKQKMGIYRFRGTTMKGNYASRRVFEKNRFCLVREQIGTCVKKATGTVHDEWIFERVDQV